MKFTSEDLMKAMGLQVGDRIKVTFKDDTIEEYEIIKYDNGNIILHDDFHGYDDHVGYLLDNEIEILPRPKRVGDMMCGELFCKHCPLKMLAGCEEMQGDNTLYECLEECKTIFIDSEIYDDEIYNIIKARLDKEVTENVEN